MPGDQAEDRAQWARSANELLGKTVGGKYRVEAILGRGGMGSIYVAEQQPLGRRVALKVLHPTLGGEEADPEFHKRFLLEAATLSRLAHPNIVVVHDYGNLDDAQGSCFMVMELLEGRTINQALNEQGTFEPARALRIARDIARALRAAHDIGVIHRDLKPANVMLCQGPEGESVKVLDFGLVKLVRDDSEELTAEGRFLGSPRYMSPEQIQRSPMDGRADLYSLGVILYRMLSGEVPFSGDHAVQTLMGHLSKPVPPMSTHGARVPPAVDQMVMKLLEKEPERRYLDASALIRAIDAIWPQLSPEPLVTSGEHPRPSGLTSIEDDTPTSKSLPAMLLAPSELTTPEPAPRQHAEPAAAPAPTPAPPAAPARRRPKWLVPLVIAVGVVAGLCGAALVASIAQPRTTQPEAAHPETQPETTQPQTTQSIVRADAPDPVAPATDVQPPEPADPATLEPAPSTFTLTVRSAPPGATLSRDGEELGETPISIELDPEALRDAPARFTLHLRGRADVHFEQGPSASDVTIERTLPRHPRHRPSDEGRARGGDLSIKTQR